MRQKIGQKREIKLDIIGGKIGRKNEKKNLLRIAPSQLTHFRILEAPIAYIMDFLRNPYYKFTCPKGGSKL